MLGRYQLYDGQVEEHYASKRPVFSSDCLPGSFFADAVYDYVRYVRPWYVIDTLRNVIVDQETVLRVCGIEDTTS